MSDMNSTLPPNPTCRQVADHIVRQTGLEHLAGTVDTFKAGDPDAVVKGVATSFITSMDVLQQAAERGLNFIVTHEPTFYNHPDQTAHLKDDSVAQAKLEFIARKGLTVWRFHDLPHRVRPDMIEAGMQELMGWPTPVRDEHGAALYTIAPTTVRQLAARLKQRIGATTIRIAGDADAVCSKLTIRVGASAPDSIARAIRGPAEVAILGEFSEWAHAECLRDAVTLGQKRAAIILGHHNSEEPGMAWISRWIAKQLPGIRVEHLLAKDPLTTVA